MKLRLVVDYLVYLAVRLVICIVQALPIETCDWLAWQVAWLAYDVLKLRRAITDENLRHAFPEKTDAERATIARGMWQSLVMMVCEIAQVPRKVHDTNYRRHIHLKDREGLIRYILDPRAVVFVSAHYGNFEVGGYATGMFGLTTHTIARTLDNPFLDQYLNEFRGKKGQLMLPKQGSAGAVSQVLEAGGRLVLLGDQFAGPKGCWIDFFGRKASCHKAVALFTLVNEAPLVLVYVRRLGKGKLQFELGLAGVADPQIGGEHLAGVKELTQWYSTQLENVIRMAPDQYWWLHDRWKKKPKKELRKEEEARIDAAATSAVPAPHAPPSGNPGVVGWLAGAEASDEDDGGLGQ